MHVPKVASNKTCKRHYVPEFPEFQPLNITLIVIDMIYIYLQKEGISAEEIQNILERKLCNCFGQLLVMHYENVENGIEHIDSAYRVCIH